jgi:DNA polymerase
MQLVFVDFETRSRCDLKKAGGRKYAEHPSTEMLCGVIGVNGKLFAHVPHTSQPILSPPFVAVANNARGFDRHIWRRYGWPEPTEWIDTVELAHLAGYPAASLDYLAQTLLGRPKDEEGNKLTLSLSRVSRKTGELPEVTAEVLQRVIAYCASDVAALMDLWPHLAPYRNNDLPGMQWADQAINDRGMLFDVKLARALIEIDGLRNTDALNTAGVNAETVRSVPQLTEAFARLGVHIPNAQKATIEALFDHPDERVQALARARRNVSTIAASKLLAGIFRVGDDCRLRDALQYYGAHTGRWAGRGMQTQNLPVGATEDDVKAAIKTPQQAIHAACVTDPEVVIDYIRRGAPHELIDTKTINTLTRACIMAPPGYTLGIVDYSGIEARAVAWMAGDRDALEIFRTKGDPYRALAAKLFKCTPEQVTKEQRGIGKRAELGCGYGMGAPKFATTVEKYGGDWSKIPATPKQCVDVWRTTHFAIVAFWKNLERAALRAIEHGEGRCWPTVWMRARDDGILCQLPSGRFLRYHEMKTSPGPYGPSLSYTGRVNHKPARVHTYGGALTENVVQAFCRDLLGRALVDCEAAGLRPVMHTHDEIVCELPETDAAGWLRLQTEIMCKVPPWAAGMPIDVDSFTAKRYRK